MFSTNDALSLLGALAVALLVLAWLSRQISLRVQGIAYFTTRSLGCATFAIFLVLLPGVFLHELAHWLAAKAVGLKAGKFRVWPKVQGKKIGMGSVSVQRGTIWQDSFVGLAPLLLGSVLIAWIGANIFSAEQILIPFAAGQLTQGVRAFWQAFGAADGALWAYLLFAIANAMMPSASDREPVKPLLLYIGLAVLIYVVLGFPLSPFASTLLWLSPTLQILIGAFLFTILLDGLILTVLYVAESLLTPARR